jgi:hypothetical protein
VESDDVRKRYAVIEKEIRFLGGPKDGMTIPWNSIDPLPPQIFMPIDGAQAPPAFRGSKAAPHRYVLGTDETGERLYRYDGRLVDGQAS